MFLCPGLHQALRPIKGVLVNDLQFRDYLRLRIAIVEDAGIDRIFQNTVDGGVGKVPAIIPEYVLLIKVVRDPQRSIALMDVFVENQADNLCRIFIDHNIVHFPVPAIAASMLYRFISVWRRTARIEAAFGQLFQSGLNTD